MNIILNCKFILSLTLFIASGICCAQNINNKEINKYLTLTKTENGYIFKANNGRQSEEYTYVYPQKEGFFETIIVFPIAPNDSIIRYEHPYGEDVGISNSRRHLYHILEIMKSLEITDDDYLTGGYGEEYVLRDYLRRGFIPDFGYARRGGKFALVTKYGDFLTDFKYNEPFWDDGKALLNAYFDKNKKVTTVLDKFTGKEIIATKDSLLTYWNSQNYLIKNKRNQYFLTYESKIYQVPEIWRYVVNPSIDSRLFTYRIPGNEERGFINFEGQKIVPEADIIPFTNFYKGHCIVWETQKSELEYDFYKRPYPQRISKILKIIDEDFETVKVLDKIAYIGSRFNKYGQIIVESKEKSNNNFVIDYRGNYIIPPSTFENRINQIYDGIYALTDKSFPQTEESREQENYYNQKGEKLINSETKRITGNFKFKDSQDGKENYIYSYGMRMITLDRENNLINSYYK